MDATLFPFHRPAPERFEEVNCALVVISNTGLVDTWQWDVRDSGRKSPYWYFSRLDGPEASWLTGERLKEQQSMLPPVAYARLWLNEWSSGGGDAHYPSDIHAAFYGML